ncbi:hypothetical protein ACGF1Z_11705 [Streptomyces sp. NPDC048018]|uniref:hypothetical protein n=1 Tax=Streptomyces sp. NPDC048018 TaxID=3365499 RepID=UPI003718B800
MDPHPAVDHSIEAPALTNAYDTSEMLRQVFLRARSAPRPEDRHGVRPVADRRSS